MTAVESALVSIWKRRDSSAAKDFLCSGVLVSDTWILTAKHAAQTGKPLWVSTTVGGPNSFPVVERRLHDELDVALLRIEAAPAGAAFVPCNLSTRFEQLERPTTLHGYFEGRLELGQEVEILRFDETERHYLSGLKQPCGQSGSPVCSGGSVWAIAVRHYADANTHRGCVIAMHQVATWLRTHVPEAVLEERLVAPLGWDVLDRGFLDASVAALRPDDLAQYFDGEDPLWPAISSGRIPTRAAVGTLLERLEEDRRKVEGLQLLIGPGGEGKTTVLMQVAAQLATRPGWRVLWRSTDVNGQRGRVSWEFLSQQLQPNTALCLFVDDAHEVRGDISDFLRRDRLDSIVRRVQGASVHLILCAHQDDWARSQRTWPREPWRARELRIVGLTRPDALEVLRGYRAEASLGMLDANQSDEALAELLVLKAEASRAVGEAALLGALLEARTGVPLDIHVERILARAVAATIDTGLPVTRCLVYTAAANFAGLHRLRESVLRAAIDHPAEGIANAIGALSSELRTEGFGASRTVRVRHGAIARRAARIAFDSPSTSEYHIDKGDTFRRLSSSLVRIVPEFWRSPDAVPMLELSVAYRAIDPSIAVGVAEGAVDGAPANIHLRSRLAQTYREVDKDNAPTAYETCQEFFTRFPSGLQAPAVRALIREWAVAAGECSFLPDHGAQNLWLALFSFSDQCGGQVVTRDDVRHLPTVSKGLHLVGEAIGRDLVGRVASIVLAVGRTVTGTRHLDSVERIASQSEAVATVPELETVFSEASEATWSLTDEAFRANQCFPARGRLTFRLLASAVDRFA